jgi:hypothetical protein
MKRFVLAAPLLLAACGSATDAVPAGTLEATLNGRRWRGPAVVAAGPADGPVLQSRVVLNDTVYRMFADIPPQPALPTATAPLSASLEIRARGGQPVYAYATAGALHVESSGPTEVRGRIDVTFALNGATYRLHNGAFVASRAEGFLP